MNVSVFQDYEELSKNTAEWIIAYVNKHPHAVLSFPGGHTPARTYQHLVQAVHEGRVDFGQASFIGLDEWVGLGREDDGSCQHFMYHEFFIPAGVAQSQIHFFNAQAADLAAECREIDEVIMNLGGINFILLGVGVNGHLGFNEPGVSFDTYSHVIDLDDDTKRVGQKYFAEQKQLSQGITLGMKHIMDADTIMVLANGLHKSEVVKQLLAGPVTNTLPASIVHNHSDAYMMMDSAAYSQVSSSNGASQGMTADSINKYTDNSVR